MVWGIRGKEGGARASRPAARSWSAATALAVLIGGCGVAPSHVAASSAPTTTRELGAPGVEQASVRTPATTALATSVSCAFSVAAERSSVSAPSAVLQGVPKWIRGSCCAPRPIPSSAQERARRCQPVKPSRRCTVLEQTVVIVVLIRRAAVIMERAIIGIALLHLTRGSQQPCSRRGGGGRSSPRRRRASAPTTA